MTKSIAFINGRINRHVSAVLQDDPQVDIVELRRLVCLRCGVQTGILEELARLGDEYAWTQFTFREWQGDFTELKLLYDLCTLRTVSWDYQSSSDREWDAAGRPEGVWDYARWGNAYTGYSSALRQPRLEDVARVRAAIFRLCKERHAEWQKEQARKRKEYGRAINARLQAEGADRRIINAYWSLQWRKECAPEEFVNYVLNGSVNWRLAAKAKGWRLLEIAGADELRGSVPRTVDLARAVCRARGEKPAPGREVRTALMSGVTVPQSAPGVWSF